MQDLFILHEQLGSSPGFDGFCVAHLFRFLSRVYFNLSSSCVLYPHCWISLWIVQSCLTIFLFYRDDILSKIKTVCRNSHICSVLDIIVKNDYITTDWQTALLHTHPPRLIIILTCDRFNGWNKVIE